MKDDQIRNLIHRLAGMSPEPPPFPEETQMARHESKKRWNPALVFAAAAAVVAVFAVPMILFTGNQPPVGVGDSTTTSAPVGTTTIPMNTSTTTPATSTTAPVDTTTTEPIPSVWSGVVFLVQTPQDSFLGNPALVPVSLELTGLDPEDPFTAALAALGPEMPELPAEARLTNGVPAEVQLTELAPVAGLITADMNQAFLEGAGGLLADYTMLNQLIYTITHGEGTETEVLFTVDGQPVEAFGSESLDLTEPVNRESFLDHLAPIFVTEPLVPVDGSYNVTGMANVFEASLMVQVLDGEGAVVHEEPVMATCGTGCWGEFSVAIDEEVIIPGESSVRLFTHSAKDGSMIDVVTVPIPAGGIWQITVGD